MNSAHALHCLVYLSEATSFMDTSRLEAIIQSASKRNAQLNITGVLLSDGQQFIQYLEGPQKSIDALYGLIERDNAHTNLKVLVDSPISKREFPKWFMGLFRPTTSEFLEMKNWEWWDNINDKPWSEMSNRGVQSLIKFCESAGTQPGGTYEV